MRHEIDFDIFTRGNPKHLMIVDGSRYFERPSNLLIEVKFPNFKKYYTAPGTANSVTMLTTKFLGYCDDVVDFPDGLYEIRMSVAPNELVYYKENYLKADKLKSRMNELLQEECLDIKSVNYLYDIDKFLTAAEAVANTHPDKAVEYYREALKKLEKYECNGM